MSGSAAPLGSLRSPRRAAEWPYLIICYEYG